MRSLDDLVPAYNQIALPRSRPEGDTLTAGDLVAAYSGGFQGCFLDQPGCPAWARECARRDDDEFADGPTVADILPAELVGAGKGKRAMNHLYAQKLMGNAYTGSQRYGNCRAWSARHASLTLVGMAIAVGNAHRFEHRHGTAFVYGLRGSSSQGMTMSRGIQVLTSLGQSEERVYPQLDLSTQQRDEDAGNSWGRSGPPQWLREAVAGDVMVRGWNLGRSPSADTVRDVLHAEGVIDHGSTYTAAESRNGLVSSLRSIGGHAQLTSGYDDTDEMREWVERECGVNLGTDFLVVTNQSWGNWLSLPKWPAALWGPRPEGAWVVTGKDFLRILGNWGDGWGLTGVDGFVPRRLPDFGSGAYL